jgi:hypothetical protein
MHHLNMIIYDKFKQRIESDVLFCFKCLLGLVVSKYVIVDVDNENSIFKNIVKYLIKNQFGF